MKNKISSMLPVILSVALISSCKEDKNSNNSYNGSLILNEDLSVNTFDGKVVKLKASDRDADLTLSKDGKIILFFGDDESEIQMKFPISAIPDNEGNINASASDLGQSFSVVGSKRDKESNEIIDTDSYEVTKVVGSQVQYVKENPSCVIGCKRVYKNVDQLKNVTCFETTTGTKVTTTLHLEFRNGITGAKIGHFEGSLDWTKNKKTKKVCK